MTVAHGYLSFQAQRRVQKPVTDHKVDRQTGLFLEKPQSAARSANNCASRTAKNVRPICGHTQQRQRQEERAGEPPSCAVLRQKAGSGAGSGKNSLMLDVPFPQHIFVLVMWKQAFKILALRSSRQLSVHNFRWSGQQSFVNPAVFSLSLQPASVLRTPAFLLPSRCLHQQAGSEQVDLNYRSVFCQA